MIDLLEAIRDRRLSTVIPCCGMWIRVALKKGYILRNFGGELKITHEGIRRLADARPYH